MKIWLDDVRPPPDKTWWWVKTVDDTIDALHQEAHITHISLDHDLGAQVAPGHEDSPDPEEYYLRGTSPEGCGCDVVKWMVENKVFPDDITIHSWNPSKVCGAIAMQRLFLDAGVIAEYIPFQVPGE